MATIYISSTYKDLIKEREAAAQAVRRLEHSTLAMEDYVASDKRPVDKCLEDVRKCDIYIGIFAWRYGFIPDGYDKSITHLEYETAGEVGIPRLIFLLDDTVNWPDDYIATGDEREKTDKLRQYLMNAHIVSFFTNPDQLGGLVSAAVTIELNRSSPKKSKLGPIVSKMVNRVLQVRTFWEFFLTQSKTFPKRPQFYFIHGNELAGHESFLERLMKTCLKEFAEKEWGEEYATIRLEEVAWPKEGNIEERREQLRFNLMTNFNKWYKDTDFTVNALSRLPCLDKRPLVLIKHNIYSSKWDKHTEPLLTWYIKEYWAALESDDHIPLFLVFFNVKYQAPEGAGLKRILSLWKPGPKDHIREKMEQIAKSSDDCPCLRLKELTPVEIEDVLDWFHEYNIYDHELERKKKIDSIFKENNQVVKSKYMDEIEVELQKIVKEYQREEML